MPKGQKAITAVVEKEVGQVDELDRLPEAVYGGLQLSAGLCQEGDGGDGGGQSGSLHSTPKNQALGYIN